MNARRIRTIAWRGFVFVMATTVALIFVALMVLGPLFVEIGR